MMSKCEFGSHWHDDAQFVAERIAHSRKLGALSVANAGAGMVLAQR